MGLCKLLGTQEVTHLELVQERDVSPQAFVLRHTWSL